MPTIRMQSNDSTLLAALAFAATGLVVSATSAAHFGGPLYIGVIFFDLMIAASFSYDLFIRRHSQEPPLPGQIFRFAEVASSVPYFSAVWLLSSGNPVWILLLFYGVRLPFLYREYLSGRPAVLVHKSAKLFLLVLSSVLVIHLLALGYLHVFPAENLEAVTKYNKAVYWTITTLTTVGYGDITPSDNVSRTYTMMVMMLGVGFYALIFGQISQYVLSTDKRKEKQREQTAQLDALFRYYGIPHHLRAESMEFFGHLTSKVTNEEENQVLSLLPKVLQDEIRIYINIKPLRSLEMFQGCEIACLADVAKSMEQVFLTPGVNIIRRGEMGQEMYVVSHGEVRVHDDGRDIARIGSGHCIGEMALIQSERRMADVTTVTYCELLKLSRSAFDELLAKHRQLRSNVESIAEARRLKGA